MEYVNIFDFLKNTPEGVVVDKWPGYENTHIRATFNGRYSYAILASNLNLSDDPYDFGVQAFNAGYRRELTDEEKQSYLLGEVGGPWFVEWLDNLYAEKGSWRKFLKHIRETYGVSGKLVLVSGKPKRKVDCKKGRYLDEETFEFVDGWFDFRQHFRRYNENIGYYYIHNTHTHYNEIPLISIILYDYVECEVHEGEWLLSGESCPECKREFPIRSYVSNALDYFSFKTEEGEKHPLFMGIELEYDTNPSKAPGILSKFRDHLIAKQDGSINGFELVSAPATFNVHKKVFEKFPFTEQLVTHRDGMHVHVDRKKLTTLQIGKMGDFIYNTDNLQFIQKIAGRELNSYCSTESNIKSLLSATEETEDGLYFRQEGSHSTALNISNKNTVEFRIFRSPNTYDQFISRLEFVKALVHWTSGGAVELSLKGFKELNNFLNFVTDHRKTYPNLFKEII